MQEHTVILNTDIFLVHVFSFIIHFFSFFSFVFCLGILKRILHMLKLYTSCFSYCSNVLYVGNVNKMNHSFISWGRDKPFSDVCKHPQSSLHEQWCDYFKSSVEECVSQDSSLSRPRLWHTDCGVQAHSGVIHQQALHPNLPQQPVCYSTFKRISNKVHMHI